MSTITSLAKSRIQFNKSRTLLTAAAIMLTTVLLTGLGTCAVGILDVQRQQAASVSNIHASFKRLTEEQAEMLKNHMDVEALETNEVFASIEYDKMTGYLSCKEEVKDGIYHGIGNIIQGHAPEAADEICGSKSFFERMDTEPVIGSRITISFRPNLDGRIETREFTICGLVSERDLSDLDISDSRIVYGALISPELVQEFIPDDERRYTASIRVIGEEDYNYDQIKAKIEAVAKDINCDKDDISLNNEYLYTMTDPGTEAAAIVLGIALLIIIFSGLVIYSIYYVCVITDVQEIGKIKALGASGKQIKRMLLTEGIHVSAFAVPLGMLLGYAIPALILPVFVDRAVSVSVNSMPIEKIHMFSLPVLLLTAGVVLLTVYISLLKPMRMAARISPVEAIRYQESSKGGKLRNGYKNVNIFRLSTANLTRNKKRTAVTMLTMGLNCVLFMTLAGVMNSMSAEDIARRNIETGDFRLALDYSCNDKEYPENNLNSLQQQNIFNEDFLDRIRGIDGVNIIECRETVLISSEYPSSMFEDQSRVDMSCIDREKAEEYQREIKRGEINYDKMTAENGAIFTSDVFMDKYGLAIGDIVSLTVYDGDNQFPLTVKITASVDDGGASYFLIPREVYDNLGMRYDSTTDLYLSVDQEKYDSVKTQMQEIADAESYFMLYSMDEELQLGSMSVNMIKYPMYAVLVMIAVIGFMNLINTMITSVVTRKREIGVLQAIGLSDRQLMKMLTGEGMVFTAGTLIASVTLGNLFGYFVFLWAKETHFMSISAYHYPLWETIGLTAVLILGQLFVTYFINKRVHKESLIDRIRSGE